MSIAEIINESYKIWGTTPQNRNILLTGGSDSEKADFILNTLLPYCSDNGKRILFLSCRSELKQRAEKIIAGFSEEKQTAITVSQYQNYLPWLRRKNYIEKNYGPEIWDALIKNRLNSDCTFFAEITYKKFYEIFPSGTSPRIFQKWNHIEAAYVNSSPRGTYFCAFRYGAHSVFRKVCDIPFMPPDQYDYVVMDEVQHLLQDASYSFETQNVFKSMMKTMLPKSALIYMTSSSHGIRDIILDLLKQQYRVLDASFYLKEYEVPADFGFISPHVISSDSELVSAVADSGDENWLIFVESKLHGKRLQSELMGRNIPCGLICREPYSDAKIKRLSRDGAFSSARCIISTYISDNDIIFSGSDFKNLAALTYDSSEFIQMIGRKQASADERLNLYIMERTEKELRNFMAKLLDRQSVIRDIEKAAYSSDDMTQRLLDISDFSEKYCNSPRMFRKLSGLIRFSHGGIELNWLAKVKNEQLLREYDALLNSEIWGHSLAKMQLSLININYDMQGAINPFIAGIISLLAENADKPLTNSQLKEIKTSLCRIISRINSMSRFPMKKVNASCSNEKLNMWLCGAKLLYRVKTDITDKHNKTRSYRITIIPEEEHRAEREAYKEKTKALPDGNA